MLAQQIVNGIALGSTYALVALGLTLVFGVLLIPNFAHGELYMLAAFITYALAAAGLNYWAALAGGVAATVIIGLLLDQLVFQRLPQATGLTLMIAALAASIVMQQTAALTWGSEPHTISAPLPGVWVTGMFAVTAMQVAIVATMVLSAGGLWLTLHRSTLGLAIRAMAQNYDAARLMGIDLGRVRMATFGIGAMLGGLAGGLLGAVFPITPTMGVNPVLKAFVVLVLGGIGSLPGAVLGGLLLGLTEVMVAGYVSSQLQDVGTFAILVVVLLLRPQGLLGRAEVER